jgi:CTP-dependent riboflavin kinase
MSKTYQDIWVKGKVVEAGYRDCATRWQSIAQEVSSIVGSFTVLDLGAQTGYYSYRLAEQFGARCLAVEPSNPKLTHKVEKDNGNARVTWLRRHLDVKSLLKLGSFDVVLALSVLHHQSDWRGMLEALRSMTRGTLVVEAPHPKEKLNVAPARFELSAIYEDVSSTGRWIGQAPGVWDPKLSRGLFAEDRQPMLFTGEVFSGSGNNGKHAVRFIDEIAEVLGYRPFPGSLNLKTEIKDLRQRLGPWISQYIDPSRGPNKGDYQLWPARFGGIEGHVMVPGKRGHGSHCIELVAPVGLRETLNLEDGSKVSVSVGPRRKT